MDIDIRPRVTTDEHIVLADQLIGMAKDLCMENAPMRVLHAEIQNVLNRHREWVQAMSQQYSHASAEATTARVQQSKESEKKPEGQVFE